jgi:hypothetical protein
MLTVKAAMVALRGRAASTRASSSVTGRGAARRRRERAFGGADEDAVFSRVTNGRSRPTHSDSDRSNAKCQARTNKKASFETPLDRARAAQSEKLFVCTFSSKTFASMVVLLCHKD